MQCINYVQQSLFCLTQGLSCGSWKAKHTIKFLFIYDKDTEEDKPIDEMPAEEVADEEIETEDNENRDNAEEEVNNSKAEDNDENRANADEEVHNNEAEEVQEEPEIEKNNQAKEDSEQVGFNIVLKNGFDARLQSTY